jgi:predicted lipid-binding transport protein (Tim44 family)
MRWRSWAASLLCAMMVLGPSLAEARAGGSYRLGGGSSYMSQGSRGSQTFSNNGAAPLQRSITPQARPNAPYGAAPGYGYGSNHPFLTGLFGGLFGSWIGSMLFPHWGMGWGMGGMFGSVFSWLLLLGLIWLGFRLFSGRRAASYGGPSTGMGFGGVGFGSGLGPYGTQTPSLGSPAPRLTTIGVTASDYQEFEEVLKGIQAAWSHGDLAALRRYTTPEMLSYFAEQLAENQSQGVANHVEDVELLKGEVREAWDEGPLQYATALLHWRARDYTVRSDGRTGEGEIIVGGDPQHPTEAREMWTFARSPGGRWLLSAIQQV